MLPFLADENFNGHIVRGLLRRLPSIDLVRVQDVGLAGATDPDVLEWAARQKRVLLTHDVRTITKHAHTRVADGLPMTGVIEVHRGLGIGPVIEELIIIAECSLPSDWDGQVRYLTL